jgi:hypothetical protein
MTSADWAARRLQEKNDQVRKLENRIKGYELQLLQSRQKIQDLTTQPSERFRSESTLKSCLSLRDYVFLMLFEIKIVRKTDEDNSPRHWNGYGHYILFDMAGDCVSMQTRLSRRHRPETSHETSFPLRTAQMPAHGFEPASEDTSSDLMLLLGLCGRFCAKSKIRTDHQRSSSPICANTHEMTVVIAQEAFSEKAEKWVNALMLRPYPKTHSTQTGSAHNKQTKSFISAAVAPRLTPLSCLCVLMLVEYLAMICENSRAHLTVVWPDPQPILDLVNAEGYPRVSIRYYLTCFFFLHISLSNVISTQ